MVFSLVYSSTTDHDWSQDELVAVLDWSRAWNSEHGVTGLLLYRDCAFMQFLEGDEPTYGPCSAASASTAATRTST